MLIFNALIRSVINESNKCVKLTALLFLISKCVQILPFLGVRKSLWKIEQLFSSPHTNKLRASQKNAINCCVARMSSANTRNSLFQVVLPETSPLCVNGVCLCVNVCSCGEDYLSSALFKARALNSALHHPQIYALAGNWLLRAVAQGETFKESIFVSSSFLVFFLSLFFSL